MTYNVFSGTLNPTHSLIYRRSFLLLLQSGPIHKYIQKFFWGLVPQKNFLWEFLWGLVPQKNFLWCLVPQKNFWIQLSSCGFAGQLAFLSRDHFRAGRQLRSLTWVIWEIKIILQVGLQIKPGWLCTSMQCNCCRAGSCHSRNQSPGNSGSEESWWV